MTIRWSALTCLAVASGAPTTPALAQSHPVGSEWSCAACSGGQVCFRANVEVTTCQLPSGRATAPPTQATGQMLGAQIAAATTRIQQNPRDANAWVTRAVYYLTPPPNGGKPPLEYADAAVRDLETAIKLDPNNFYARHNYAHVAYLLGYDDFAITEFNKALVINPGAARSYLGRGWAYVDECKFDEAAADFRQTVQLDAALQPQIASPQAMQDRRQACAALDAAMQRAAAQAPPRTGMPDLGLMYERNEAIGRANRAEAAGNHDAARIIREQSGVP